MKKLYKCLLILVVLTGCFFPYFRYQELKCHIYMDYASSPALAQLIDALKQNKADPKMFFWRRLSGFDENDAFLKKINAKMPLNFYKDKNAFTYHDNMIQMALDFINNHPEHQIHLYFNIHQYDYAYGHLVKKIPSYKITSFHIYEDSITRALWQGWFVKKQIDNVFKDLSRNKGEFHQSFSHLSKIKHPRLTLKELDFSQIGADLSDEQKEILAHVLRVDLNELKKIMQHDKIIVFFDDPSLSDDKLKKFLDFLVQEDKNIKDYVWVYKNHPRSARKHERLHYIQKITKNIIVIPPTVPYEALRMLGLKANYVAGYSSSVFFYEKNILGYIPRKGDPYQKYLMDFGFLKYHNIFEED